MRLADTPCEAISAVAVFCTLTILKMKIIPAIVVLILASTVTATEAQTEVITNNKPLQVFF
jgi:hypothetical protein